uniref:Uncharacterized protein n=1 Tax=Pithovirus LCPAC404 TaxID=2506597 RepID=A0A481ZC07_9VIRU|nr:MAG: protein of unknown function DUF1664 [Pithovirus LCPAC404]
MDSVKSPGTMISFVSLTGVVGLGIWTQKQFKGVKDNIESLTEDINLLREDGQTKELCNRLAAAMQEMNKIQQLNVLKIDKLQKHIYLLEETLKQNEMEVPEELVRKIFPPRRYPEQSMYPGNQTGREYFDVNEHYHNPPFHNPQRNDYYGDARKPQEDPIAAEIRRVSERSST